MPLGARALGPVTWAKSIQTYPCFDVTHKKLKSKLPNIFNRSYKTLRIVRKFEQLGSSSGWRIMARNLPGTIVTSAGQDTT